ncbi:MAG: peptidylprolyl isomerase, partial [Oscillospiraceae bacterium]|nr:peptidylprolyl isomerase [Oscillospiraceae bacterium]
MKKFLAILLLLAIAVSCFACSKEEENPTESTSDNASLNAETTPNTDPTANPSGETQPPQGDPTETTEPTEPPVLPEMEILGTPGYGMNDSMACNHYTVTEATPTDENMTTPLAVFGPNQEVVFENRHLQIAYWMEYLNFMGTYGSYASMVGMDTTLPLWAQEIDPGKTWEQYFLDFAVKGLERNYALARYAAENGIELTPEQQSAIDDILSPDGDFATEYTEQGYADGDSYISYYFGAGANVQAYYEYYAMYSAAANCYQVKQKELAAALTEADILAYYAENKEKFETQGKLQVNNINVRHILLQPEGEESTWTEETWAAAEAAAQAIYDEWLKNPTEENFAALATEHTTDPGSKDTGGLYEEV